jgi:hypothetical protein
MVSRRAYLKTFKVLQRTLSDHAFAFSNKARTALSAGFSIYHFEAITIGLQSVLDRLDPDNPVAIQQLKSTLQDIKLHREFIRITTGGGKNSPGPLRQRIKFVEDRLLNAFPG